VSKGGDLHRELKKRGKFEERDAAVLLKQILVCVNYCHKNNVIHRDLKPGSESPYCYLYETMSSLFIVSPTHPFFFLDLMQRYSVGRGQKDGEFESN